MSWAIKRKLIYLSIFIVLFAVLIGVPGYLLFHQSPTCFDGKENQGEQGIDCGGPCVKLCSPLQLAPVVLWSRAFPVVPGIYSAVAYIQNPNLQAQAFGIPYTFDFYDSQNNLLAERKGTVTIPAGTNFAIFESNISIAGTSSVRTDFELSNSIIWQAASPLPQVNINNVTLSSSTVPTASATLSNSSYTNLPRIDVTAIIYDPAGNAFAASKTFIASLPANSSAPVVFTWPEPFSEAVGRIEIIPIINESSGT